ncbi:MAG: Gfo/Idh/MocA family protein [Phycisphaerae bacterium]
MTTLGIGIFGLNGHQLRGKLPARAKLVASAGFDRPADVTSGGKGASFTWLEGVPHYDSLDAMLADERVQMVSLCSPVREEQAGHAIRCLEAGRHVYAEKPVAFDEPTLDRILAAAKVHGRKFRDMADTFNDFPLMQMRRLVAEGFIGEVVQVFCQKSYPIGSNRPQDEAVDGGLLRQVGIHAVRMIELVSGKRFTGELQALETRHTNPGTGHLRIACSGQSALTGGGIATFICNYRNPAAGFGQHGNEHLRLFGTRGFIETTDGHQRPRLVTTEKYHGPLPPEDHRPPTHLESFVLHCLDNTPMPFSLEDEMHAERVVIHAKHQAKLIEA